MHKETIRLLKASVFTGLFAAVSAHAELVRNPTQVGTSFDMGQIVSGNLWNGGSNAGRAEGQVITRTGVYLTESGVYNNRLTISLTIGGLFWFGLPEEDGPESRRIQFGPGVGQAQGVYAFGEDPQKPAATLQFGLFPYKYSDAVNLGEYLYRSGTYPGYLLTGGWSYINSASYMAQGAHLSVPMMNGMITHDFTLFMERDYEPADDFSPGYAITVKPTGFLEVGAGVVWSHGLPLKSDKVLTPKTINNAYDKSTGRPVNGDTASTPSACADELNDVNPGAPDCGYYTYKGFKMMGRASMDFGTLLGMPSIKAGDFKLYTEVALLGVKDYPGYYDDKAERMPILLGLNVPTFGVLDRLTFEGEYRKSRWHNTIGSAFQDQFPIPVGAQENYYQYDGKKETSWKWTVYARRQIINGISVYAQAADDHLRHFTFQAVPSHRPSTEANTDWYYVVRLEFGI